MAAKKIIALNCECDLKKWPGKAIFISGVKWGMMIRKLFQYFRTSMFPCPGCGGHSGDRCNSFCPDCLEELELFPPDIQCCPGCGGKMSGILGVCSQCLAEPERPWHHACTLAAYQGRMRELIQRFKFYNVPELARPFGLLLADRLQKYDRLPDMIIPIPLHFVREWSRGYNQSLLMAQILGNRCGIPVYDILRKSRWRSRQSKRSRSDRHRKLADSFILTNDHLVKGRNILLLDDVFTTGATLHAATAVLLKHAPASVSVMTLARAIGHSKF